MTAGVPLHFNALSKRFGDVAAVKDLTFTVEPGRVTGFLGPNGAGKTTTMRMLLGLVTPTTGTATFDGIAYRDLPSPMTTVGAALEAASFHPGRSAFNHLAVYARAAAIPLEAARVALERVGLAEYGSRRVGGYSLGMRQRLGLAFALLGDPGVLVLDEPVNGLDPEGIKWTRGFLRHMADEGRTVMVSSHLLSEVAQSVDEVVVITHGELAHTGPLSSLDMTETREVLVDGPDRGSLQNALTDAGYLVSELRSGLLVSGAEASDVGHVAFAAGVELSALSQKRSGLEDSFLALVGEGGSL